MLHQMHAADHDPDYMQEDSSVAPYYVYTQDGIFRINDDLIIQDLCQNIRIEQCDWKNMFQKQTCFSGDAVVEWVVACHQEDSKNSQMFDNLAIVVTHRMVTRAGAQGQERVAEVCWFVRVVVPTNLLKRTPGSKSWAGHQDPYEEPHPMGESFVWPLTIEIADDLYKTFNEVLSEEDQGDAVPPELRPTHEAVDLSTWSSEEATLVEHMPEYYDRLFALSVAPALHTPRTALGHVSLVPPSPGKAPAEWIAPGAREWLSKSTLARAPTLGTCSQVRPVELHTGFDFMWLPEDIKATIFNDVVAVCTETVMGADFRDLLKLRTVCKDWKAELEARASQRLAQIVRAVKGAINAEDTDSLIRARDRVLGHGIPVPRLLGDAGSLDFYNFMRLRFSKRPGALPPDVPRKRQVSSIGTTSSSTNTRLALTFSLDPVGPVLES